MKTAIDVVVPSRGKKGSSRLLVYFGAGLLYTQKTCRARAGQQKNKYLKKIYDPKKTEIIKK